MQEFLPEAVLTSTKNESTVTCKVTYKNFNWISQGFKLTETKESVVIKVFKEIFEIDLLPENSINVKELKMKLQSLVKIREKAPGYIASVEVIFLRFEKFL